MAMGGLKTTSAIAFVPMQHRMAMGSLKTTSAIASVPMIKVYNVSLTLLCMYNNSILRNENLEL